MPLHRMHRQFLREQGIDLPVSTLADWVAWGGRALQRLAPLLLDEVLAGFLWFRRTQPECGCLTMARSTFTGGPSTPTLVGQRIRATRPTFSCSTLQPVRPNSAHGRYQEDEMDTFWPMPAMPSTVYLTAGLPPPSRSDAIPMRAASSKQKTGILAQPICCSSSAGSTGLRHWPTAKD